MDQDHLRAILEQVKKGELQPVEALEKLRNLPYESLDFATIDHHRALRCGFPEVVMGEKKSAEQMISIMEKMAAMQTNVLMTRVEAEKAEKIRERFPRAEYNISARTVVLLAQEIKETGRGTILVVTAGTSDIPVAEEAAETARVMGNRVERIYDVGVAGIHRVLDQRERLQAATVIIVVAGMEGALPSVVSGLVARPVIAVPTSVGYGVSFNGVAALLGMLNSCSSGVAVVNIDNGFGAGCVASLINRS